MSFLGGEEFLHGLDTLRRIVLGIVDQPRDGKGRHLRSGIRLEQLVERVGRLLRRIEPQRVRFWLENDGHPVVDVFHERVGRRRDDGAGENRNRGVEELSTGKIFRIVFIVKLLYC